MNSSSLSKVISREHIMTRHCPLAPVSRTTNHAQASEDFISDAILERLANGSLSIWGKVGLVFPLHLVLPLPIEPSKPRLCHDERFLNLWIRDLPFTLDYISNLPRYVEQNHYQSTMDDKSGYDHVKLSSTSRTYVGLEWKGWHFVFNTIPFGWKASAYLYHTIGMAATSYVRSLDVPCSQYIDDMHVGQLASLPQSNKTVTRWSDFEYADAVTFICASVLVSLGYFIGLSKSCLVPQQLITFLGFIVDSTLCTFLIPEVKKKKFADLRESILSSRSVSVKTLQRFAGKVTSFSIAVPSAQLYAREIYRAISGQTKSFRLFKITGALRKELEHWRFLDAWKDCLPWPRENHLIVKHFSDASDFAWGGVVQMPDKPPFSIRDFWSDGCRHYPIVVKEGRFLLLTLQACKSLIANSRLDVNTDNMAFMQSWLKQWGEEFPA